MIIAQVCFGLVTVIGHFKSVLPNEYRHRRTGAQNNGPGMCPWSVLPKTKRLLSGLWRP